MATTPNKALKVSPLQGLSFKQIMIELPPETYDQIIDHLHADKSSLIACALTCKSWFPSAHYHLFSAVDITPRNLVAFERTLRRSLGKIAPLVKRLVLKFQDLRSSEFKFIEVHALTYIMMQLPHLTSLALHGVNARFPPFENSLLFFFHHLPNVEELELQGVTFETMKECTELVNAFPKLRKLSMVDFCWLQSMEPQFLHLFQQGPAFRVGAIGLGLQKADEIVDFFLARDPIPVVETLHCYTYVENGGVGTQRLMAAAGQHITTLDISVMHAMLDDDRHIDFANCSNVRSVIIRRLELSKTYSEEQRAWVPTCLLKMGSSKIEEISLFIRIAYTSLLPDMAGCVDSLDWKGLQQRVAKSRLPQFRKLAIHWDKRSWGVGNAEDIIKNEKLASLHGSNQLQFYGSR